MKTETEKMGMKKRRTLRNGHFTLFAETISSGLRNRVRQQHRALEYGKKLVR